MNGPSINTPKRLAVVLGSAALAACGGVLQLAEIEGSGYSDGAGSGYGSVYVNGTRFTTDVAAITIDGASASEADLEIGMLLQVDGDVLAGIAQSIRYDRDLRGPIDRIERANLLSDDATLEILGQSVRVDSRTRYVGTDLDGLTTDMSVEISGLRAADGSLRASLLRLNSNVYAAGTERVDVEGHVTAVSNTVVRVGQLQIDLAASSLSGQVAIGDHIEAFGLQTTRGGVLRADQARRLLDGREADGPQVQLDGLVTAVSGSTLSLGGQQVDISNAERGDASGLPITQGARLIVTGTRAGNTPDTRLISARRVVLLPAADLSLTGSVSGIDFDSEQLVVLGQTLQLLPHTQFIDDSAAALRRFRTADLSLGDTVELLAYASTDGNLAVARLRRIDPAGSVTLRGEASEVSTADESLSLAGVAVRSTATTVFTDAEGNLETAGQFFANISNGTLVEAVGSSNGLGGLNAERLTRP